MADVFGLPGCAILGRVEVELLVALPAGSANFGPVRPRVRAIAQARADALV